MGREDKEVEEEGEEKEGCGGFFFFFFFFFSEHTQQKCQKIPLCNQHDVSFPNM